MSSSGCICVRDGSLAFEAGAGGAEAAAVPARLELLQRVAGLSRLPARVAGDPRLDGTQPIRPRLRAAQPCPLWRNLPLQLRVAFVLTDDQDLMLGSMRALPAIQKLVAEAGANPVITMGFAMADPLSTVAPDYPDTKFVVIDVNWLDVPNLRQVHKIFFFLLIQLLI
mgnify:CR=1 FL=1